MKRKVFRRDFDYTEHDFSRARRLINRLAGISIGDAKQDLVYSRLSRRVRQLGLTSVRAYLDLVEPLSAADPEVTRFINALTTNLTAFFREEYHFDHLRAFLTRPGAPRQPLIWCAAAATGEEPYSIAMAACEAFNLNRPPVRIIATDIDTDALEKARSGVYERARIRTLSEERRQRFFLSGQGDNEGSVRVKPTLQSLIEFRQWNLLSPYLPPWRDCDVVFCRNVMIYFDKPTQLKVLTALRAVMRDSGVMYAGHSESLFHAAHLFRNQGRTTYLPVAQQAEAA